MEKRTVSKSNRTSLPGLGRPGETSSPLNVMCVYQDALTHEAARLAERDAANGATVGRRSWWNVEAFDQPGVLAGAAYMAMRADVIVVALTCREGLPLPFYVWANSWLPYRKAASGTLVAVLDDRQGDSWAVEQAREYLRQVAAHANMQFRVETPPIFRQTAASAESFARLPRTSAEPALV